MADLKNSEGVSSYDRVNEGAGISRQDKRTQTQAINDQVNFDPVSQGALIAIVHRKGGRVGKKD